MQVDGKGGGVNLPKLTTSRRSSQIIGMQLDASNSAEGKSAQGFSC
jgi:hypothetical protein